MTPPPLGTVMLKVVTNLGDTFPLAVEPEMLVREIRTIVREMSSRPKNLVQGASEDALQVKMSVRGVVLQDDDAEWQQLPLPHNTIRDEERLFVSITVAHHSAEPANIPVGASRLLGVGGNGGDRTRPREEEEAERDRARMMEPIIDSMVQNPQFFDSMVNMQPELKNLIREHPELEREMRNPEVLKQMVMSQLDPDQRRQMNRTMQLQMAQISNTPGGSAMLERYMQGMQRDGEGAVRKDAVDLKEATEEHSRPDLSQPCNSAALPNPWQRQQPAAGVPTAAAQGAGSFPSWMGQLPRGPSFSPTAPPGATGYPFAFPHMFAAPPPAATVVSPPTAANTLPPLPPASRNQPSSSLQTEEVKDADYSEQLVVLLEMGFEDVDLCVEALHATKGDIDAAVKYIDAKQNQREASHNQ